MNWIPLTSSEMLLGIKNESENEPIVIFKHSTSCSISGMSKMRLESSWKYEGIKAYYLDLLSFRSLSNAIALEFDVHHESPQILLIYKGECIYDASHFDISVEELDETLEYHSISI